MKTKAKPKAAPKKPLMIEVTPQLLDLFEQTIECECEGAALEARHGNWKWALWYLDNVKMMLDVFLEAGYVKRERKKK